MNDNDATTTVASSLSQRRWSMTSVEPVQIVTRIRSETSAVEQSKQKFNDCLRELHYVKGCQMYGYGCDGSIVELNPKKCTEKHESQKWGFLPCSHFFCANCHSANARNEFDCSVCGKTFSKQMTRFIDTARLVLSLFSL